MTASRLTWARVGDRYPDLAGVPDDFLALDESGAEVGLVKLVALGPDEGRWLWSMLLTHPGPAFNRPTNGTTPTRREAAIELAECWRAFRRFYGIE